MLNNNPNKLSRKTSQSDWPILDLASKCFAARPILPLQGITMIAAQHLRPSIIPLFEKLIIAGADPARIHLLGKCYSDCSKTILDLRELGFNVYSCAREKFGHYDNDLVVKARRIWRDFIRKEDKNAPIIILDHGGFLKKTIPNSAYGLRAMVVIEHTKSGLLGNYENKVPLINHAESLYKRILEPVIICRQAIAALERLHIPFREMQIGIIGAGTIGSALCHALKKLGCTLSVYDQSIMASRRIQRKHRSIAIRSSIQEIFHKSDLIFGCSSADCSAQLDFSQISGRKTCASLSSSDREFATIISKGQYSTEANKQGEIITEIGSVRFKVLHGGFPINFFQSWRYSSDIDPTRALTYFSVLQAADFLKGNMIIPVRGDYDKMILSAAQKTVIGF